MEQRESPPVSPMENYFFTELKKIEDAAQGALNTSLPREEREKQFEWLKQRAHNCVVEIGVLEEAASKRRAKNFEYVEQQRRLFNRIMEILPLIQFD